MKRHIATLFFSVCMVCFSSAYANAAANSAVNTTQTASITATPLYSPSDNYYFNPTRWMPLLMHWQIYQYEQRPNEMLAAKVPTPIISHGWGDRISINGGINVQGIFSNHTDSQSLLFTGPANDQLNLRAAYFGFTGYLTSWARAYVSLNYEPGSVSTATGEPYTAPEMEQAYVQMKNPSGHFRFDLGKQYLPFSVYEHYPLVVSLAQKLSEINKVAAVLSTHYNPFFASIYAFGAQGSLNGFNNGANTPISENELANGGAEMGFKKESKIFGYEALIGYMNNLAETRYIYGLIKATHKRVSAVSLHLSLDVYRFGFLSNFIYPTDSFSPQDITFNNQGARPWAYDARLNYTFDIHHHPLVPVISYQYSDQELFLSVPQYTYTLSTEYWINKYLIATIAYLRSKNYAAGSTGSYATSATSFTTITGNGLWNNTGIIELAAHF